ncbi:hypothetical protein [Mycolicibacterium komossense]|uniref:Uncharacterized protein n=1 Tax=Mycolicibacterium komossense TaxID=1779 RepID=A0ABT3C8P8_9MYCO|nr:hypothetical protein [Mycolicibacterium komossense]MCV7225854.1 hypothetical protein [Mycolicibacterium komossense]
MDWSFVAGALTAIAAAIAGQIVPFFTRREDRKHEALLEFERRNADDKRKTLLAVIHWANGIRAAAAASPDPIVASYVRADILAFAAANQLDHSDEITAYTSQEVQRGYQHLNQLLERALIAPIRMMLSHLEDKDRSHTEAIMSYSAEMQWEGKDYDLRDLMTAGESAALAMRLRAEIDKAVASTVDANELHRLASELIEAAKADLRGHSGKALPPRIFRRSTPKQLP